MRDSKTEKRMIEGTGYTVKETFWINGKELLLAENLSAEDGMMYMVCQYIDYGFIAEYSQAVKCDDYLEALQDFSERIGTETAAIKAERDALNLPATLFTAADCYPHSYSESIAGKVVAIKPEVFSPEFRRGDVQLVYAVHGFGVNADSRGSAIFCHHLNDGKHARFERHEVLGVVKELPDWAIESLARIQSEMDKPLSEKEYAGNYEITERIEVGSKVIALGYCEKAADPYGTWLGRKSSRNNFDFGHYFGDYEAAKTDLHDRAAKEQERMDSKKLGDKAR
jgi:hypothetical protein